MIRSEQFQQLAEDEQKKHEETIEKYHNKLQKLMRQVPQWSRENREKLQQLDKEMATFAVNPLNSQRAPVVIYWTLAFFKTFSGTGAARCARTLDRNLIFARLQLFNTVVDRWQGRIPSFVRRWGLWC